jgi:hypothetical protein
MLMEQSEALTEASSRTEVARDVAPVRIGRDARRLSAASLLALQRSAGNRATSRLWRSARPAEPVAIDSHREPSLRTAPARELARCPGRCTCGGGCRGSGYDEDAFSQRLRRAVAQRAVARTRLQRETAPEVAASQPPAAAAAGCAPNASSCSTADASPPSRRVDNASRPANPVSGEVAREIVGGYLDAFRGLSGAVMRPFPELVASATPTPSQDSTLATFPASRALARSGIEYHPEGGVVGSLQLCYDLCTAQLSLIGWIWAGGGVEVDYGFFGGKQWYGAYVFAERDFGHTTLDFMPRLQCGRCEPACSPEHAETEWGGGIAGFPMVLRAGERKELRAAGIEVGALISERTSCDADLEVIALVDLTAYIPPPYGIAIRHAIDLVERLGDRIGVHIECGAGIDLSGTVHLCQSVPGGGILGITSDSAQICFGGFFGCNVGLPHEKTALPGVGTAHH